MGNLYGKFREEYLSSAGIINKKEGEFNYLDFVSLKYQVIKSMDMSKLKEIFDDFYGGKLFEKDDKIVLTNIPIRILYFETGGISKIIAIGHVQNDSWICESSDKILTGEEIAKEHVKTYLKNLMDEFPRSLDKFMHIFESNSYEMCELLNLKDVSPLDFSMIFKEAFKIISKDN